jgi:hypothetical protein
VEQSSGRSWDFVGISREGWGLRDGTPPNKKKHLQTRKNTSKQEENTSKQEENTNKQEKHLSSKGNAFQARGIFRSNVKVYKW